MVDSVVRLLESIPPITLLIGVVLLLAGGRWLVDGSVRIARRLGVSTLFIGLTVVAFGTSSPELFFNVTAALGGNSDLSFGNVVGSNIANIALVLGAASLIAPLAVHGRIIRMELPLLIGVSALMLVLARTPPRLASGSVELDGFSRVDGAVLMAGFALVTWAWFRLARADKSDPLSAEAEEEAREDAPRAGSPALAVVLFVAGLLALMAGGKVTEIGAVGTAERLGLSSTLVGLTFVALATSLPELVTSIIAMRRGHSDLAVGNVVGSNLFNILLVLGLTALCAPVGVPAGRGWFDLLVMFGFTIVLFPIAFSGGNRITKVEGTLLLAGYAAYIVIGVVMDGRV
jgi:cation:H+ antiporter